MVESNYSFELNNNSPKHGHGNCYFLDYYYEVYEVNVKVSGYYMLSSESNFYASGSMYIHGFDPHNTERFLSVHSVSSLCETNKFKITDHLYSNITYVLIVTTQTAYKNVIGMFSVNIKGPGKVIMKHIGMYIISFPQVINQVFLFHFKIIFHQLFNQYTHYN